MGELVLHISLVFGCGEIQIQRSYRMKLTNETHGLITFSILPQNFTHQDFNIIYSLEETLFYETDIGPFLHKSGIGQLFLERAR